MILLSKLAEKNDKNKNCHFYFLNKDVSVNIQVNVLKPSTDVNNIHMEGTVSESFRLRP